MKALSRISLSARLIVLGLVVTKAACGMAALKVYFKGQLDNRWETFTTTGNWIHSSDDKTFSYTSAEARSPNKIEAWFKENVGPNQETNFDERFVNSGKIVEFATMNDRTGGKLLIAAGSAEAPLQFKSVDSESNGVSMPDKTFRVEKDGHLRVLSGVYTVKEFSLGNGMVENVAGNFSADYMLLQGDFATTNVFVQNGGSLKVRGALTMESSSAFTNYAGTVELGSLRVGSWTNRAVFAVLGGHVVVTNNEKTVQVGGENYGKKEDKSDKCEIYLGGGVFESKMVQRLNGKDNRLVFNGGTLKVLPLPSGEPVQTEFINNGMDIYVGEKAGVIDTSGCSIAIKPAAHTMVEGKNDGGLLLTGGGDVSFDRSSFNFTGPLKLTLGTTFNVGHQYYFDGSNRDYPGKQGQHGCVVVLPEKTNWRMNGDYVVMYSKNGRFDEKILEHCLVENAPAHATATFSIRDAASGTGSEVVLTLNVPKYFTMSIR